MTPDFHGPPPNTQAHSKSLNDISPRSNAFALVSIESGAGSLAITWLFLSSVHDSFLCSIGQPAFECMNDQTLSLIGKHDFSACSTH